MEADKLSRARRIESGDAASVFTDPKRRRILVAFLGCERSLSDAAKALDMPLNRLAYHVGVFLRLGLIEIVREQKRAGRPILYYRSAADSFLVPAELMRRRPGDALATELREALEHADRVSGRGDMLLFLDAGGRPRIGQTGGEAKTDASDFWRVLALSRDEAEELGRNLADLVRAFEDRQSALGAGGGSPYLVHFAVAPRRI